MADDCCFHPKHGRLQLKRSRRNGSGYESVYERGLAKGRVAYYAKHMSIFLGDGLPTAREAAIRLAVHLAENPPPAKKAAGKVCA